jgi:NADH-quinone oxidoreductase subunit M
MTVLLLVLIPIIGGIAAWLAGRRSATLSYRITLAVLALALVWLLGVWLANSVAAAADPSADAWISRIKLDWIPRFGISLHLGLDGLSLLFCALTLLLGLAAVVVSRTEIRTRTGFFHLNILWTLAGTLGVFVALDLFLFFLFWELMLVPMFFVIALWGHGEPYRAAMKFFLFTQGSGLLMLIGILLIVLGHQAVGGGLSFDLLILRAANLDAALGPTLAFWAMLGLFVAFAVKLPTVPLHGWLPDAHTVAPTGGSVLLAGILLKTGGYGLIRVLLPLLPEAAAAFAPVALGLGVLGILYGALLALAQTDIKRLVAYSGISHMGFVLLGVFAGSQLALTGAIVQMLAHGLTAAALFIIAGGLYARFQTLDAGALGGAWQRLPRLSALTVLFAVATLGLPGFGNFVGELLVLLGTFRSHPTAALVALSGLILAAVYSLALVQRILNAPERLPLGARTPRDSRGGELATLAVLAVLEVGLGLYPQPVLDLAAAPLDWVSAVAERGLADTAAALTGSAR